jgi:hypothetical protein
LWRPEGRKWVLRDLQSLKKHFIDNTIDTFFDIQNANKELSKPFGHLKHRFLDLVHFAFLDTQKAKNGFAWPIDPLNIA